MSAGPCRSVVLKRRPHGEPTPGDFGIQEDRDTRRPVQIEVVTRTIWLSIDPLSCVAG